MMRVIPIRFAWLLGVSIIAVSFVGVAAEDQAAEYNNMGIAAYNAGHFSESIRYFEKAHELARDNATVRHNLCNSEQALANELAKNNRLSEAIDPLKTAIGIEPENPAPLIQLGAYYLQLDEVQQAIFRLEEAIELKPGELAAHELLGEAYYRDNDLPSARVQWDYVLQMDPKRKGLKERYEKAFREESVENGYRRGESRHFKVSCPSDTPALLRSQVLTTLERAYLNISRKLNGTLPPTPIQVVLYGDGQFSEATQMSENIAAVYDGKIRAPLTDGKGTLLAESEMDRRLTHEYVHVAVRAISGDKVPWWVNEGLAQTLSQELEPQEAALLRQQKASGALFTLAGLEAHQLKAALAPERLNLAYAESHAAVKLLWDRYGQRRFVQMLRSFAEGVQSEAALRDTYGIDYSTLQEDAFNSLP